MVPQGLQDDLARMEMVLSAEQLDRLSRYLDLLLEANRRVNLTAVRDRDAAWRRLILDSLTLVPGLESLGADEAVIDIGSGGGLPGIPLAIARPDLRFALLEATGKKARFLEEAVSGLGLERVTVVQGRAEAVGQQGEHRQRYAAAVSRAVGSVAEVLEYGLPLVRVGGRVLIVKGAAAERELADAGDALVTLGGGDVALIDGYPADRGFESELVIVSVIKERPTPRVYPRPPGMPRQSPL